MKENPFPKRIQSLQHRTSDFFEGKDIAYELPESGVEVFFAAYPGGLYVDFHSHPTENVGLVSRGKFTLIWQDGREQSFGVGDWYHIPENTLHASRIDEETAFVEFWFEAK